MFAVLQVFKVRAYVIYNITAVLKLEAEGYGGPEQVCQPTCLVHSSTLFLLGEVALLLPLQLLLSL